MEVKLLKYKDMQMTVNQKTVKNYQSEGSKMNKNQSIIDSVFSVIDANNINPASSIFIDEILSEIHQKREALEKEKLLIFYPKQTSKDEHTQDMGLAEENNALLFLSTPQSSYSIKSKLINAIELNKIDFASTIFQKLLPQVPSDEKKWSELKYKSTDKFNIMLAVKTLYKKFTEVRGIDLIDAELIKLDELLTQIKNKQTNEV